MSDSANDERLKEVSTIRKAMIRPELGAICGAILVFAFFLLVAGDSGMFSPEGVQNWTIVSAQFAILAAGACLLMIAGEFDLSVGSMIGFAGIIVAILSVQWGWPIWVSILVTFALCVGLGAVNGFSSDQNRFAQLYRDPCVSLHPARVNHLVINSDNPQNHHRRRSEFG